jgi:predicted nucleic acid-binding Zn ribbon protein
MSAPSAQPTIPVPEPTHGCVRCGDPVPMGVAMCERCNPLGLAQPAASQAHGTVFLAIGLAVIGLALAGRFALAGIGPFTSSVDRVDPALGGLAITITVTNQGTHAGSTTCRVYDPTVGGIGPDAGIFQSPEVGPGQTLTFRRETPNLGDRVRGLAVQCGR